MKQPNYHYFIEKNIYISSFSSDKPTYFLQRFRENFESYLSLL